MATFKLVLIPNCHKMWWAQSESLGQDTVERATKALKFESQAM